MATQEELMERIRQLESENSELQDRLDMIYAIVAPADEAGDEAREDEVLVEISLQKTKGVN